VKRRVLRACATVGVVALLGACGSSVELEADRARALQADVLALTAAAAAGKWDVVEDDLRSTRALLDAALESADVSVARYRQIDDALDGVAAEVEAERDRVAAAKAAAAAKEEAAADEAEEAAPSDGVTQEAAAPSDPATTEPRGPAKKDDQPKGKDDPGPPKGKGKGSK
jgi:hypothetical protein